MCRRYKDAIFLSPHKFVGGTGTPGKLMLHIRFFYWTHVIYAKQSVFVFQACLLLRKVYSKTQSRAVVEAGQCYL